ncbi:hypothetical protein FQZ97_596290 [compost metagenome]
MLVQTAEIVVHCRVVDGVGADMADRRIAVGAIDVTDIAHPGADTETVEGAAEPGVVGPQRGRVVGDQLQAIAVVRALFDLGIGVGVGADQLQFRGDVGVGLELETAHLDFADLTADTGLVDRDVFLGQVEHRCGQQYLGTGRLVLQAQFVLVAFGRFERGGGACAGRGLERLGVGNVGREAGVEHVAQRGVAGDRGVAIGAGGAAEVIELGAQVGPVLACAEGQAPVVEGHLVLDIEAGAAQLLVVVAVAEGIEDVVEVTAVHRVEHVGRWHARGRQDAGDIPGVGRVVVVVPALVVEAEQQGVADRAGLEIGLQVVVDGELADVLVGDLRRAGHGALVVDDRDRDHALQFQVGFGVAQVLAELPDVVEAVLEGIAERVIGAVVVVEIRVAEVFVVRDLAGRPVDGGALVRQERTAPGVVAGELAEEGQLGVVVEVPGQARRDVVALVVDVIDRLVAVAHHATDAVEELALVVDLAGAVEVDLPVVVVAVLQLHCVAGLGRGAQADQVEQAAGRGLAVDRRGRAAQHGDAFEVPGFGLGVGEVALGQWQAVEELGRGEAARADPLRARVAAVGAGYGAGHVAHGIVETQHGAVLHLLAGGYRDRAWGFQDRRVGLAGAGRAGGDIAVRRSPGAFRILAGVDIGRRQGHGILRQRRQAIGAGAALHQLQAATVQGGVERAERVVVALYRLGGLAGG